MSRGARALKGRHDALLSRSFKRMSSRTRLKKEERLRSVPAHIWRPGYWATGEVPPANYHNPTSSPIQNDATIAKLRVANRLAREMLDLACSMAVAGVTTDEIDEHVHKAIIERGAYPAPLNYMGFPKSLCASNNDRCCHGIPDEEPLKEGDIVSFDVSVFVDGVFGDNCSTLVVGGSRDPDAQRLVDACKMSLDTAIDAVGPGVCLTAVGDAVASVAYPEGFGIVKQYCGHGIGTSFHTPPLVQHFPNNDQFLLMPGHVFTIEPILTERPSELAVADDEWSVFTRDGARAAQFEHTVLITPHGTDVLTVCD